jgi:hypothetical protein
LSLGAGCAAIHDAFTAVLSVLFSIPLIYEETLMSFVGAHVVDGPLGEMVGGLEGEHVLKPW